MKLPELGYKLSPPKTARTVVRRMAAERLALASPETRLCLVSGPAGFGKTTFLAHIYRTLHDAGKLTAWLSLDAADNDPQRFLYMLSTSMNAGWKFANDESDVRPWSRLPDGLSLEWVFDQFAELARQERSLFLFLDDAENVSDPQVIKILQEMISHLPEGSRVFMGARQSPPLELARLRINGSLTEVSTENLRFNASEVSELINNVCSSRINEDLKHELLSRTEGWPAAIQLAALAVNKSPDAEHYIRNFAGTYTDLADYLSEEILTKQSNELRKFLAQTSILETLDAAACNAVCDIGNAASLLQDAVRANLFVFPLNSEQTQFKYHKLFSEYLLRELKLTQPELIPQLHHRATDYYEGHDRPTLAVHHALQSNDTALALRLISANAPSFTKAGQLTTVISWVESLPKAIWRNDRDLAVHYALALVGAHQQRKAVPIMESLMEPDVLSSLAAEARGLLLFTVSFQLLNDDQFEQALERIDTTLRTAHEIDDLSLGALNNIRAFSLLHLKRYRESQAASAKVKLLTAGRSMYAYIYGECINGLCEYAQGNLRSALSIFRQSLEMSCQSTSRYSAAVAVAASGLADALYETNEPEQVEKILGQHYLAITNLGVSDIIIIAGILSARLAYSRHGLASAYAVLNDMRNVGAERDLERMIAAAWLEQSRMALLHRDLDAANRYFSMAQDTANFDAISDESSVTAQARLRIYREEYSEAEAILAREIEHADASNSYRYALKLRLLRSLALFAENEKAPAFECLRGCVDMAAREGFCMSFVNEGAEMMRLLREFKALGGAGQHDDYLARLISLFDHPIDNAAEQDSLVERLSRREYQILQLIDKGYTNQRIANKIFLSLPTIKTHVRNIMGKLHAKNRSEAVAIARRQRII